MREPMSMTVMVGEMTTTIEELPEVKALLAKMEQELDEWHDYSAALDAGDHKDEVEQALDDLEEVVAVAVSRALHTYLEMKSELVTLKMQHDQRRDDEKP
jgi:hypothetical protein